MGLHIPSIPGVKKNELDENHILVYNFKFKKAFAYRKKLVILCTDKYCFIESFTRVYIFNC